jgi:hypothetical protein
MFVLATSKYQTKPPAMSFKIPQLQAASLHPRIISHNTPDHENTQVQTSKTRVKVDGNVQ